MNDDLQVIARQYLVRLRYMAAKHGLGVWLDNLVRANKRDECEATEKEVRMLSRLCDDDSVKRADVPKLLGKSYRRCVEDSDFEHIRTIPRRGIYDKVHALLLAMELKRKHK